MNGLMGHPNMGFRFLECMALVAVSFVFFNKDIHGANGKKHIGPFGWMGLACASGAMIWWFLSGVSMPEVAL